jgi:glucose/arabinose dehydrogenase
MVRLLFLAALLQLSRAAPNGFIDEGIADLIAITGAFAPNPHNAGKPMLLLSSKEGIVMVLEDPDNDDDMKVIADFDSRLCSNGERGLQTIRPHPDFAENRWLYVYYTRYREGCLEDVTGGPRNRLSRFTMRSNSLTIDMNSEVVLIQTSPSPFRIHNGGAIQLGNDGKIWMTIGDGGSRKPPVSQDDGILFGSVLRLNHDGSVPDDNPFAKNGVRCGNSGGIAPNGKACSEIYATGLRNPFRLVIDPNTVDKVKFHVGDVGASAWEEVRLEEGITLVSTTDGPQGGPLQSW